ncbi:AAA family ATPase [Halovivax limisalsi]|uniref:AAA family ATPase n=1 Tax=Halovivax limisalsi TaxID=1453760 RepID=UPI001FFCFA7E|nr:AAA family ATPase [Halovivax limisalsi]
MTERGGDGSVGTDRGDVGSGRDVTGPAIVEPFGAPGAGKTTLAREVLAALPDDVAVARPTLAINESLETPRRQLAKLPFVGRGLRAAPTDPLRYAAVAGSDLRPSLLFNWLYAAGAVDRSARRPRVTVFDQAIAQAYWSIAVTEPEAVKGFARRRLAAAIPPVPYVLVCVRASAEVVADRLGARTEPQSRIGAAEPGTPTVADAVETTETVRTVAADIAAERPTLFLRTIEADDRVALDAGVKRVVRTVRREATDGSNPSGRKKSASVTEDGEPVRGGGATASGDGGTGYPE